MIRTKIFWLAAAITAFVLVTVGSVAGRTLNAGEQTQPDVQVIEEDPLLDPDVQAFLEERDAAYEELIREANDRLEDAYNENQELATQLAGPTQQPEPEAYEVSPELAVGLAISLAPGSKLTRPPELVLFENTVAYEIVLDKGTIYIGAENGWLLFDGTISTNRPASVEHDDDDDDDDDDDEYEDD
jgi:hypothetical protein